METSTVNGLWDGVTTVLRDAFRRNELMSGGIMLMLVGAVFAQLYQWWRVFLKWIHNRFFFSVEVHEHDEAYPWLLQWLCEQPEMMSRAATVVASTERTAPSATVVAAACVEPRVRFEPAADATHFLWHNKALMWVRRSGGNLSSESDGSIRRSSARGSALVGAPPVEQLRLTCFGRSSATLRALLTNVVAEAFARERNKTSVWVGSGHGYWSKMSSQASRPWDSVVVDAGIKDELLNDVEEFLRSAAWYVQRARARVRACLS